MKQTIRMLQNNLKQKDEQILHAKLKLQNLTAERGEMIKMIEKLTEIMNNDNTVAETSSAIEESSPEKSWADKVEEEEESKNDSEPSNVAVDPIDEQLGKNVYVIFDGPMKGIYQKWAIAKLHINGKNVRHKAYPTMEQAKAAYNAAYKEITNSVNIQKPANIEIKKKVSVDAILNLEKLRKKKKHLMTSSENGDG
jgi:hypothetical protein